jgi:hypothetical protein
MSRTCQFSFVGRSGPAEWSFDEVSLVVTPAGGGPLVFPVQELAGIAGDGYTIELTVPGTAMPPATGGAGAAGYPRLSLSKLGAEGPTLLDALQRTWLVARAKALRLGGSGTGKPFSGMVTGMGQAGPAGAGPGGAGGVAVAGAGGARQGGAEAGALSPEPFRALLFEDVMLVAREARDLDPIFMALTEGITFDEEAYAIRIAEWPDRDLTFFRLAKQTQDLLDSLGQNRQLLANEAATILASSVPSLPVAYRGLLAGDWPPGRLRTLQGMSATCPGFEQAFRAVWLAACVRKDEGGFLLDWAGPGGSWLGCSRETTEAGEGLLWLLAGKDGIWFLEALTGEDRATYHFRGGDEMPALVSRLLCAPQFSKEALYGRPDMLTGDRADLAIAAQFLGFLADLRARFRGRVIHSSPESWRQEIQAAAAG